MKPKITVTVVPQRKKVEVFVLKNQTGECVGVYSSIEKAQKSIDMAAFGGKNPAAYEWETEVFVIDDDV